MDKIEICEAMPEDWEYAMELAFRVFLKFEAKEYGKEGTEAFASFVTDEMLKKLFLAGHYILFVAKMNEKIVGLVSIRNGNHLSLLFVDASFHRRGIGSLLLDKAINYLKENTLYNSVSVNAAPYAIDFYKKLGFAATGEMTKKDGIKYLPMEKAFCKY